jgi:hypothetical protein
MRIYTDRVTTVWLTLQEMRGVATTPSVILRDRETGERRHCPVTAYEELAKGIADVERAESRGFMGCEGVFVSGTYDGLHERATPNEERWDWGRGQDVTRRNYFRDGQLVRDPEWKPKPPEAEWESHGLRCRVYMTDIGHRCGYVRVDPGHPWHSKDYNACLLGDACTVAAQQEADPDGYYSHYEHSLDSAVSVHGGVTFASTFDDDPDGWWLGFDCAHAGDAPSPEYVQRQWERYGRSPSHLGAHHWTLAEVREETERMAEQIASVTVPADEAA